MVNPTELLGRKIAVILFMLDSDDNGVCFGIVERDGDRYSILGSDQGSDFRLPLTPEMLGRIQRLNDPNPESFEGAEFFVPMSVGRLPESANPDDYPKTGLRWTPNAEQD